MTDAFPLVRIGDRGVAVADVKNRLDDAGFEPATDGDVFDEQTRESVESFQRSRNLACDGIVGPETWDALIEAGWHLGDRRLYERRPWLRGDDVSELQERLGALGFDVGKIDGIFGPLAREAVLEFQRNAGLAPDGIAGPETIRTLHHLSTAPASRPSLAVREWIALRGRGSGLEGRRVFLDPRGGRDDPGTLGPNGLCEADVTYTLALDVAGRLRDKGAHPLVSRGPDDDLAVSDRAALANWFGADVVIGLGVGDDPTPGARGSLVVSYFGTHRYVSDAGKGLAASMEEQALGKLDIGECAITPARTPLLRETRAVAVNCELNMFGPGQSGWRLGDVPFVAALADVVTEALAAFFTADEVLPVE